MGITGNVLDSSSDEETSNQKIQKNEILKGYKGNKDKEWVSKKKKNKKKSSKENDLLNDDNTNEQTVEEWLLCSGLSATTCSNLVSNGYDTMSLFLVCTQDDIDAICKEFNLSTAEKLKLKAAINELIDRQTKKEKVTFKKGDCVIYDGHQYEVVSVSQQQICIQTVVSKSDFHKI